jgi:hypothetical protein
MREPVRFPEGASMHQRRVRPSSNWSRDRKPVGEPAMHGGACDPVANRAKTPPETFSRAKTATPRNPDPDGRSPPEWRRILMYTSEYAMRRGAFPREFAMNFRHVADAHRERRCSDERHARCRANTRIRALSGNVFLHCTTTNAHPASQACAAHGKTRGHNPGTYRFSARFPFACTHISNSPERLHAFS